MPGMGIGEARVTPAESAAADSRQAEGRTARQVTPRQLGGWAVTLIAWAAAVVQPQDSGEAAIVRALAITLTILCVMVMCYEALRRGQQGVALAIARDQLEIAERMQDRFDEALAQLSDAVAEQGREIRRTRKRVTDTVTNHDEHTQECTDELCARVQHLSDLVEAHSLLLTQAPLGPLVPTAVLQMTPKIRPHG